MTTWALTAVLFCAAQDKVTWGKIEFTKVGPLGAEYRDALKEADKKHLPVMIFFTCG